MSTIFPGSASVGQIYEGYTFNGIAWDLIGNEFNPTSFSPTAPEIPKAGDLWVDSSSDVESLSPENILTTNAASALYLTHSGASATYLSQVDASIIYLDHSTASSTYLSQTSASSEYATKTYTDSAISALVDSSPSTLNTLNELAAALGDDPNFATTITNALSPVGSIVTYAMATPPSGWLLCDGSIYSASAYPTLSAGLGSTYGGNGTTTFGVPNLRGRVVVGIDSAQTEFDTRGETGGSKTSVAPHDHSIGHDHGAFNATSGGISANHSHGLNALAGNDAGLGFGHARAAGGQGFGLNYNTGTVSSDHSHTTTIDVPNFSGTSGAASAAATSGNLQPYMALNYIIRAV
jgi:microcystin-dependent protein